MKMQIPLFPYRDPTTGAQAFVSIFTKLVEESRIVFLSSGIYSPTVDTRAVITDIQADCVTATLLYLNAQDPNKDIKMYINSPGGSGTAMLAVYDTMQYVKCDVQTICIGQAASAAAIILAAGTKGKRSALPNAEIMIHQPLGGAVGQATDVQIRAEQLLKTKQRINQILAKHTGQPMKKIAKDTDRDFYMSPEEALAYGLIDRIITPKD